MHIPDGFLTNRVALSLDALSGLGILYSAHRLKIEIFARFIPIMGVLSAFVFAAQMLNFPVFGGTSGHLVGGALLGIMLGPTVGFLTMATVIIAQAVLLQDGGIIALGANLFNIGALTTFSGYAIYRLIASSRMSGSRLTLAGFAAGWFSVMLSAAACALELGISGAIPLRIGLPAMTGYHAVIGIVEGALTAGVLSFVARARPDLLRRDSLPALGIADWAGGILLVAIPLAILGLAGSSSLPDPLQALLTEPSAPTESGTGLLSPDRFRDFYWVGLCLLLCLAAFLASRLVRIRRRSS